MAAQAPSKASEACGCSKSSGAVNLSYEGRNVFGTKQTARRSIKLDTSDSVTDSLATNRPIESQDNNKVVSIYPKPQTAKKRTLNRTSDDISSIGVRPEKQHRLDDAVDESKDDTYNNNNTNTTLISNNNNNHDCDSNDEPKIDFKSHDCLAHLLSIFNSMEPPAQLELWKLLIENHPFNLNQLRSLQAAIDDRIKVDIISNVPYEIALYIMSFLEPKDLCQAAQTCHSWRTVCEDSRLWREKCREDGLLDDEHTIYSLIKKRISENHSRQEKFANQSFKKDEGKIERSEWKLAYLKHISVLRNWRTRRIKFNGPFINREENPYHNSMDNYDSNNNFNNNLENIQNVENSNHDQNSSTNCNKSSSKYMMQLRCHEESVITCLQYNPKTGTIVSGSDDLTLKVWCSKTGRCITTLEGHSGGVWSSQLSPDDIVISGSTDRTLKVWEAHTGKLLHSLHGHTSTVRCLALDDNRVVSGSRDTTLRIWDIIKGQCLHVFTGHTAAVRCVEFKNNIIVSGAYDHLVMVWDAKTGLCCHVLECHLSRIYSLQFDGKTIASGSLDSTICIWDVTTGKLRHHLEGHQSLTSKMQLKRNLLVSANADSYCKVWNINTGECLQTLGGANKHISAITSVYFNSRHVVTSSDDGTVKLWDIKTGEFLRDLVVLPTAHHGGVVWRIRASYTKLICAVGSRAQTEDTHLLVLDFNDDDSETGNYENPYVETEEKDRVVVKIEKSDGCEI